MYTKRISDKITKGISYLIVQALQTAAQEQYHPGADPDRMDEIIKDNLNKAAALRRIRTEFEDIITGVIHPKIQSEIETENFIPDSIVVNYDKDLTSDKDRY